MLPKPRDLHAPVVLLLAAALGARAFADGELAPIDVLPDARWRLGVLAGVPGGLLLPPTNAALAGFSLERAGRGSRWSLGVFGLRTYFRDEPGATYWRLGVSADYRDPGWVHFRVGFRVDHGQGRWPGDHFSSEWSAGPAIGYDLQLAPGLEAGLEASWRTLQYSSRWGVGGSAALWPTLLLQLKAVTP